MTQSNPVLSRPYAVDRLPAGGASTEFEADDAERAALAQLYGLPAVAFLRARFTLKPQSAGAVLVSGRVEAGVTQVCVVSADDVDATVVEDVELLFMPEDGVKRWLANHRATGEDEATADDQDPPDTIVDGQIDLGVLAGEYLALGIDPYPRKPGLTFDEQAYASEKEPSPFAALASLKKAP